MMRRWISMRLVAFCGAVTASLPPSPAPSIFFSAGFSSDMVLQHSEEQGVAVYGVASSSSAVVSVSVSGVATYGALVTTWPTGDGTTTWRALLRPTPASNEDKYTVTVKCESGCADDESLNSAVLERVVFGDVFFCSGQSNMALSTHYTFSSEIVTEAILNDKKWSNVHVFQYGGMSVSGDFQADAPRYTTSVGSSSWYNLSYAASLPEPIIKGHQQLNPMHSFAATCLYFGIELSDLRVGTKEESMPIGLMQAAVGGTQIEAWLDNATLETCANISGYAYNTSTDPPTFTGYALTSKLFYGMVTPFVNMSLAGWVWYQGENNAHGNAGNSLGQEGYGCEQVALVELWRAAWSSSSAASSQAPFGLVSLAAGGSEGATYNIGALRWSQTGNFGMAPNKAMPNTFLAHGYDIGDPWAKTESENPSPKNPNCSYYVSERPPSPDCVDWDDSLWNAAVRPLAAQIKNETATPYFMGSIHPRFKREVGRRLATAFARNISGPALSDCTVDVLAETLTIHLDPSRMLSGERVVVQPFDSNVSNWKPRRSFPDSSSLMICTDANGPEVANATTCGCLAWNYFTIMGVDGIHKQAIWYCARGPADAWQPSQDAIEAEAARRHSEASEQLTAENPTFGFVPVNNPYILNWQPAPLLEGSFGGGGSDPVLTADLSGINGTILAVRYGWPLAQDTCCPHKSVQEGLEVCRPASCPIISEGTSLPMNPFFANIKQDTGRCECLEPQQCTNQGRSGSMFV